MKRAAKILCIFIFRALERRLSVRNLYRILKLPAFLWATIKMCGKENHQTPLPQFLQVNGSAQLKRQRHATIFLSNVLDYFPDQLPTPKWKGCCRIHGLERVQTALQNGRPVILALVHFGPYWLMRAWLRSVGIPFAPLVGGRIKSRPRYRRQLDKYIPMPEVSPVFYLDQLRKTSAFLAAGNVLGVTIDNAQADKTMSVPFCEGWTFQMATGAVRLAIRQQAELIPCIIADEGDWQFRLELGRPVPKEFLAQEKDWPRAGKHLLEEMMPLLRAHPEQCQREFIGCLQKNSAA